MNRLPDWLFSLWYRFVWAIDGIVSTHADALDRERVRRYELWREAGRQ